jgi:hypothetical protein
LTILEYEGDPCGGDFDLPDYPQISAEMRCNICIVIGGGGALMLLMLQAAAMESEKNRVGELV